MKKLLSVCTLALVYAAQTASAQTDAKAKLILDGVTRKMNSMKSLKASFSLKLTGGKGGKVTDSKSGTIAIKGQKYHVLLSGNEIICDNKTIWNYNPDAKEVTITAFNPSEQSISPAKLLTNFYDKEYKYKYAGEKKSGSKNCDVIELTPTDNSKQVSRVELLVDKSNSMIAGGTIWSKNGNKTEYSISNVAANAAVPDTYFTWDANAHKGVETNDLR